MASWLGWFKPTSNFSSGRPVFINIMKQQYLHVYPGNTGWTVGKNIDVDLAGLRSGSAPDMHPASVRSGFGTWLNVTSWQYYWHDGGWHNGNIQVTCDTHEESTTQLNQKSQEKVLQNTLFDRRPENLTSVDNKDINTEDEDLEIVLVTSEGESAEYHGGRLGLYKQMETQYNNAPTYTQWQNVTGAEGDNIYFDHDGVWYVGTKIRNTRGTRKKIPRTGWEYWRSSHGGEWMPDPKLRIDTITNISSLICPSVTITAFGKAAKIQSFCLGQYKATSQFSAGRPVFFNDIKQLYLFVRRGSTTWRVHNSFDNDSAGLVSGSAPDMNPASARGGYSNRFNQTSWQYSDDNGWHNGDIQVICDNNTP